MISFKWRHFQKDIILLVVRWYAAYSLCYRNKEVGGWMRRISKSKVHHMLRKGQHQQSAHLSLFEQFYALAV